MATKQYLTNKEFIAEIIKSRNTFCWFASDEYKIPTMVVDSLPDIATIEQGTIIKLWTHEHIPDDPTRKGGSRNTPRNKAAVSFKPFKHYLVTHNGYEEVARSHWKGNLENGAFSVHHGRATNELAKCWDKLIYNYARLPQWSGYSYKDEMKEDAMVLLVTTGLQFDETKSPNAFAYYTSVVRNEFIKRLQKEKEQNDIREKNKVMIKSDIAQWYADEYAIEVTEEDQEKIDIIDRQFRNFKYTETYRKQHIEMFGKEPVRRRAHRSAMVNK